jgi:hypothetical protein
MSLWAESLTVAGLACLTFGTGAQAWAFRTEFSILKEAYDEAKRTEVHAFVNDMLTKIDFITVATRAGAYAWLMLKVIFWSVLRWRSYARRIFASGGEEAVALSRLLRQAIVWAILTLGSALVLAGAVIALIHDT